MRKYLIIIFLFPVFVFGQGQLLRQIQVRNLSDSLVSKVNINGIKTVNGSSLVGTGNLIVSGGAADSNTFVTQTRWKGGAPLIDTSIVTGDSVFVYGTSIDVGSNGVTTGLRWPTQFVRGLVNPSVEVNRGISGTAMSKVSNGDSSFTDRLYTVPKNRNTIRYLVIGTYPINECTLSRTVPVYVAALSAAIDTLLINRGYPLSKIILCEPPVIGTNGAGYGKNNDSVRLYSNATDSVATARGIKIFKFFQWQSNNGGKIYVSGDSIHPNDMGHWQMTKCALTTVGGGVNAGNLWVNNSIYLNQYRQGATPNVYGSINFGGLNYFRTIIRLFDNGGNTLSGIGYTSAGATCFYPRPNLPLLFGNGGDSSSMTTTSAGFYLNSANKLVINTLGATLPFAGLAGNQITGVYSSSSIAAGLGYTSAGGYVLFGRANIEGGVMLRVGGDATNTDTSNASMFLRSTGNVIFNKPIFLPFTSQTANYTVTATDYTIKINSSSATTVTLPSAYTSTSSTATAARMLVIKNTGTGAVTINVIASPAGQTIDGLSSYTLSSQYKYVILLSDNSNWMVIGNN